MTRDDDFIDILEIRDELGNMCLYDEYMECSPACPEWERCGYIERGDE